MFADDAGYSSFSLIFRESRCRSMFHILLFSHDSGQTHRPRNLSPASKINTPWRIPFCAGSVHINRIKLFLINFLNMVDVGLQDGCLRSDENEEKIAG